MKKIPLRIKYLIALILLIIIEVLIALFVHDNFVRPYLGDVIVVFAVYCAVRVVKPTGRRLLAVGVFVFAVAVEGLQAINIVDKLGLGNIRFFKVLCGSVFDVKDILCYAVGCAILLLWDLLRMKPERKQRG